MVYTERTTGGALPCSISRLVSTAANVGSAIADRSGGGDVTVNDKGLQTLWATVMLLLREVCNGEFTVTRI